MRYVIYFLFQASKKFTYESSAQTYFNRYHGRKAETPTLPLHFLWTPLVDDTSAT